MEFYVYETRELVQARHRPIIIITSNNEKELPDAFLRRCFFHYIRFPDEATMRAIVAVHYPDLKQELLAEALGAFFEVRATPGPEEEALDLGAARLDQAAGRRGHRARGAAQHGCQEGDSDPARRAAEERAGRAPVRAAGVHAPPRALKARCACWCTFSSRCVPPAYRWRITEFLTLLEALQRARGAALGAGVLLPGARLPGQGRAPLRPLRSGLRARCFTGAEQLFAQLLAQVPAEWLRALTARDVVRRKRSAVSRRWAAGTSCSRRCASGCASSSERHAGRQQVDRHRRHLALRRARLQPAKASASARATARATPRGQGVGAARVPQLR